MQNRFKFRVWKGQENRMVYDVTYLNPLILDPAIKEENKHNILMQCTGLKDKNGKLIYEGDIIDKGTRCKWVVTWFRNRFILVPDFEYENRDKCVNERVCGFKYFENNHNYADRDNEVIGNIYENKELLNE